MKENRAAEEFNVVGQPLSVIPIGNGNVNDTYLATFKNNSEQQHFIIQKLNLNIFTSPEDVMHNMKVVTEHVSKRASQEKSTSTQKWKTPEVIPTKNGKDFLLDEYGDCWRAMTHIDSATAYEEVQGNEHAYQAGIVLGRFQHMISDIPLESLKDTLPGFHITSAYLNDMDKKLKEEVSFRKLQESDQAKQCSDFINERRDFTSVLEDACLRGKLQQRPIHGDPKISNIMIDDETGKGISIIDLDTVKPGLIHYDFGDCMRSCCNPAGEDPTNLDDVYFNTDLCRNITQGYMKFADRFLTDTDKAYLYDSIRLLTFELGLRFFSDHLSGNTYFKTTRKNQNLNRATAQFRLCKNIEEQEQPIRNILKS